MKRVRQIVLMISTAVAISMGCMWDRVTIIVENAPFPSDMELVSGDFARPGEAYLRWKVADRTKKIKMAYPGDPADWDDLAVAWDKLGEKDSALNVMLRKRKTFGVSYETMANLGTFFFHTGRLEDGISRIDSAIKINPDAHFGREIYQLHLVEYFLSRRMALPMDSSTFKSGRERGFAAFVAAKNGKRMLSDSDREKALQGVLGMMRFGDYRSPVLLEAWGDLQVMRDTGALFPRAAMGYLQASRRTKDDQKMSYRKLSDRASGREILSNLERVLDNWEAKAATRANQIEGVERQMVDRAGFDVDSAWQDWFLKVRKEVSNEF